MSSILLELQDSTLFGEERPWMGPGDATECMVAVDELAEQFSSGKVKLLALSHYHIGNEKEPPIWYDKLEYYNWHGRNVPLKTNFYSSHYIGYCKIKNVSIIIHPRFGETLLNYLLGFTCNLYIPQGKTSHSPSSQDAQGFLLIALLWKAMLERAISIGQIPKEYITESKRISRYKGRLNISKHIRSTVVDSSKFYCTYRKLSLDSIINRTIRYTFSLLSQKDSGLHAALEKIGEYDNKLASFGVVNSPVLIKDIDKIRYTKLNYVYKPVMSFSRAIISHREAMQNPDQVDADFAYFIDIAELWELYLLKLLRKGLEPEYRVFSPNALSGDYLLQNNYREIRPDIMIEKDEKIVMIIDAKYKNYRSFGQTAKAGISREDLYQMNTYLYKYGSENEPITGLFVSPVPNDVENDIHTYEHNPKHRIGLLNINLLNANKDISLLHIMEQTFISQIKKILSSYSS